MRRPLARSKRRSLCVCALALALVVLGVGYHKHAAEGEPCADSTGTAADENPLAGCTMCHIDVEDEFVGGLHYNEKVGCKKCHGPSEGHVADENNEVKPDELFARNHVDRLCGTCHECPRPEEAKPAAAEPRKVCTDCHGAHEFPVAAKEDGC